MLWIFIHLVEYIKLVLDDENVSHVAMLLPTNAFMEENVLNQIFKVEICIRYC